MLESDDACTVLNGHCARKTKVLVLVCFYKARAEREQDCEGTVCLKAALRSGMTGLQIMVASATSV